MEIYSHSAKADIGDVCRWHAAAMAPLKAKSASLSTPPLHLPGPIVRWMTVFETFSISVPKIPIAGEKPLWNAQFWKEANVHNNLTSKTNIYMEFREDEQCGQLSQIFGTRFSWFSRSHYYARFSEGPAWLLPLLNDEETIPPLHPLPQLNHEETIPAPYPSFFMISGENFWNYSNDIIGN